MKYYSEKLKKIFDAESDLLLAEKANEEQEIAKKKELDVKRELAKQVEDAYKEYIKTASETNKIVQQSREKYAKLRDDFIKKYGSFHMSFTTADSSDRCNLAGQGLIDLFDIFKFL